VVNNATYYFNVTSGNWTINISNGTNGTNGTGGYYNPDDYGPTIIFSDSPDEY